MAATHEYNAHFHYKDAHNKHHYFYFFVMDYDQPFELAGSEEQSKNYKHFYAKSYAPGDMTITGRSPYQTQYNNFAEYIREFHNRLVNHTGQSNAPGDFIPMLHLLIPSEGVDVYGLVKSFKAGARRFNVAPEFTFDFMVIKNQPADQYIGVVGFAPSTAIKDNWSGKLVGTAHPQPKKKKNHKPAPKKITHKPHQGHGPHPIR